MTEKLNFCMSKLYQDSKKYLLGSFDDQLYILDIAECHSISKQKTENIFSNQRFSSGDKFDK